MGLYLCSLLYAFSAQSLDTGKPLSVLQYSVTLNLKTVHENLWSEL
jgi:hypothetical protein